MDWIKGRSADQWIGAITHQRDQAQASVIARLNEWVDQSPHVWIAALDAVATLMDAFESVDPEHPTVQIMKVSVQRASVVPCAAIAGLAVVESNVPAWIVWDMADDVGAKFACPVMEHMVFGGDPDGELSEEDMIPLAACGSAELLAFISIAARCLHSLSMSAITVRAMAERARSLAQPQ